MSDGQGCKCAAYAENECACDADWTPKELIEARAKIKELEAAFHDRVLCIELQVEDKRLLNERIKELEAELAHHTEKETALFKQVLLLEAERENAKPFGFGRRVITTNGIDIGALFSDKPKDGYMPLYTTPPNQSARIAELKKDAARYRFIKYMQPSPEGYDEAIDAALKQENGK